MANKSGINVFIGALAFVLMLALLVAVAAGSSSRTSERFKSQEFVERTQSVLHEIDGMEDTLQDAREAALHYVLTPEKEDLINFDSAVALMWTRLDRIVILTRDDKGYPERMEQLRGLLKAELRQLSDNMRTTHTLLIFGGFSGGNKGSAGTVSYSYYITSSSLTPLPGVTGAAP